MDDAAAYLKTRGAQDDGCANVQLVVYVCMEFAGIKDEINAQCYGKRVRPMRKINIKRVETKQMPDTPK